MNTWPREIAGHFVDRRTRIRVHIRVGGTDSVVRKFYCVDCGRIFDAEPDREALRDVPCESPSYETRRMD